MSQFKPLVSEKIIKTYTCPACKYSTDREDESSAHEARHEFRALKDEVHFLGNSAHFGDEEQAQRFLRHLFRERIERKDMDDDYEQSLKWTGPGEYFDNYHSQRDDYYGTYHSVSTWTKLR